MKTIAEFSILSGPVVTFSDDTTHPTLRLANTDDALTVSLAGVKRVELDFPKFTDGRAYSQAHLLRRRRGFAGDIRATGDVLVDQLVLMKRSGFSSAVLRSDQDAAVGALELARFDAFYQGDVVQPQPHFARQTEAALP